MLSSKPVDIPYNFWCFILFRMLRGLGICTALLTPLCWILRGSDSEPTSSEKAGEKTVLILPAVKPDTVAHRVTDLD